MAQGHISLSVIPTSTEGREIERGASHTAPISKVMKASTEPKLGESSKDAIGKAFGTEKEEYKGWPMEPRYTGIGRSTVKPEDLDVMKRLRYIDDKNKVCLAGEETTPQLKDDHVVVFNSFFRAELRLPIYRKIAKVLKSMKCIWTN
jgi:hypothetical protein